MTIDLQGVAGILLPSQFLTPAPLPTMTAETGAGGASRRRRYASLTIDP
jgi:hypothetical protein